MLQRHSCQQLRKVVKLTIQTLEIEVQILDGGVLEDIDNENFELKYNGKDKNQGVRVRLSDADDKQLFFGYVRPNVQYEYEVT